MTEPLYPDTNPAPKKRRGRLVAAGLVASVAVVGGGAYAGYSIFLAGGPSAATALPANTLGYVTLDLDPSAGQKIEALQVLNKFPALKNELNLDSRDDLRKKVFELIQSDGECEGLDYQDDVEPWLGERAAVAALPVDDEAAEMPVEPLIALEVSDESAAESGIERLFEICGDSEEYGIGFVDDYMLISPSPKVAEQAAKDAAAKPLSDTEAHREAMDRLGDAGVATFYLTPEALETVFGFASGQAVLEELCADQDALQADPSLAQMCDQMQGSDDTLDQALEQLGNEPVAMTLRFADGAVELAAAGASNGQQQNTVDLATLPQTTIAAIGIAWPEGWSEGLSASLESLTPFLGSIEEQIEANTGLRFPEDVETLLGESTTVVLDSENDFAALEENLEAGEFDQLRFGLKIKGDTEAIKELVADLLARFEAPEDLVRVETDGDIAVVTFSPEYAEDLLVEGDLGSVDAFKDAVGDSEDTNVGLFVDFNKNDWLVEAVEASGGDADDVANVKPLASLGVNAWVDGDVSKFSLRLATD